MYIIRVYVYVRVPMCAAVRGAFALGNERELWVFLFLWICAGLLRATAWDVYFIACVCVLFLQCDDFAFIRGNT